LLYKVPTKLACDVSNEPSLSELLQVATLEQQVANSERQRQQEAASLCGSAEHMQREMQGHCTNLQAQLDAFQVPFTAASCRCLLLLPFTAAFQVTSTAASHCCVSLSPVTAALHMLFRLFTACNYPALCQRQW
jgi:hypothetical protein